MEFEEMQISQIKKKCKKSHYFNTRETRASLVVQWLRIHLPMQRTRLRVLVQEDPTCHGAPKPVSHNY